MRHIEEGGKHGLALKENSFAYQCYSLDLALYLNFGPSLVIKLALHCEMGSRALGEWIPYSSEMISLISLFFFLHRGQKV